MLLLHMFGRSNGGARWQYGAQFFDAVSQSTGILSFAQEHKFYYRLARISFTNAFDSRHKASFILGYDFTAYFATWS